MIIGIHPDRMGEESYSDRWAEFLREQDVEVRMLNLLAWDGLERAGECDGVMWRWAHDAFHKQSAKRILYAIEHYLHIPVFPDTLTAWHFDEKNSQYYLLRALQAPVPETWLFWDADRARFWVDSAPYPLVFKLSVGAGSSNVLRVDSARQAQNLVDRVFGRGIFPMTMNEFRPQSGFPRTRVQARAMWHRLKDALRYIWTAEYPALRPIWWKPEHSYAYFQEFLDGNEYDTRITVIGDRAFGFRRMNRTGDFRASGSGKLDHDPSCIDTKCIEIAFRISERGKFQSMAYDFMYKNDQPVIVEISYAFSDWAVHACPGYWNPDLQWVEGRMWPEQAQAQDFATRVREERIAG